MKASIQHLKIEPYWNAYRYIDLLTQSLYFMGTLTIQGTCIQTSLIDRGRRDIYTKIL